MPTTSRPSSAMMTVRPANTTALTGGADRHGGRLLGVLALGELRPVPRQDEERVVDADREADHQREQRAPSSRPS